MSWKVLMTVTGAGEAGRKAAERLQGAGCEVVMAPGSGPFAGQALEHLLDGCDAVLAGTDGYTSETLGSAKAGRLKIISRWGVGYDTIDVAAATREGIIVAYTPGLTDEAVADFTFALLLSVVRRVVEGDRSMREGLWLRHWGHDLAGKTLGILGFGRIGQAVARRGRGFGLGIIASDRHARPEAEAAGVRMVGFEELLAESDILSLHAPMREENRGLIGESALRKMKRSAYLINTARGPLVDERALARALSEGWIAGAAVDVYAEEPPAADNPLRKAPNLLLSPHVASSTIETGERVGLAAAESIIEAMAGRRPKLALNTDVFGKPQLRAAIRETG